MAPNGDPGPAPLGWGLIGASDIAANGLIPAIRAHRDCRVAAVLSSSAERGAAFARDHGVPASHTDLDALLADPGVDAVYVSTTNELHRDQTVAAARAGKHVLCEKPLALSVADGRAMVTACADAGVVMGTNHGFRASTPGRALRRLVADGAVGRVAAARVFHAKSLPERLRGWRLDRPEAGAGVVLDITVHDADTLRFVLGDEVEAVTALTAQQGLAAGEVEDAAMGVLRMAGGALASFHDAFTVPHAATGLEVHGTDASLVLRNEGAGGFEPGVTLRTGDREEPIDLGPWEDAHTVTVRRFVDAVRGDGTPACTGEDGVASLAVALAVLESARTGRTVTVAAG